MTILNSNHSNYNKTNKIDFKSLAVKNLAVMIAVGMYTFVVEPMLSKKVKQKEASLKD